MGHDRVALVQRFGSSFNLNPHMHVTHARRNGEDPLRFSYRPRRCPNVQQIVQTSAYRILCLCTPMLDDIQADLFFLYIAAGVVSLRCSPRQW